MDAVKLSATLIAIAFLIAFVVLLNVKAMVISSVNQVFQLKDSLNQVKIRSISSTEHNITLSLSNPFNVSMYVYNATGQYVYLKSPIHVPPMSQGNFTLVITNPKMFYELAQARQENITLYLGIGTFNFTQEVNV
ncbi:MULTISPECIES: hypothetical protein [Metallosphaera]|uniref:Uncharacterized protein n=3 Tax=Metallosphaera TaxID=41980 RepID=A4YDD6_METS5|nr:MULTISPECIES: hypothetical protein [Metallosphaera]ABP94438.1 hypothetical protein Msed_0261 [Metallosphaera sedula DSM 5348]AIM26425.1 hypothetical protein HA72_0261 [Metallosphaera sedula]AKV73426.1 hypothetical protein MsedA_0272 [Metallosphaera sedula]AKV75669.1 hypothetical protein MsedB_0272 [Metallosphaera sedula]AKV77915.1 hypothetical protein MsedC_0271 [Metallosphaera sedula]